jgi:hypothetical protein
MITVGGQVCCPGASDYIFSSKAIHHCRSPQYSYWAIFLAHIAHLGHTGWLPTTAYMQT